jgi:hypothetical protein
MTSEFAFVLFSCSNWMGFGCKSQDVLCRHNMSERTDSLKSYDANCLIKMSGTSLKPSFLFSSYFWSLKETVINHVNIHKRHFSLSIILSGLVLRYSRAGHETQNALQTSGALGRLSDVYESNKYGRKLYKIIPSYHNCWKVGKLSILSADGSFNFIRRNLYTPGTIWYSLCCNYEKYYRLQCYAV